MRIQLEEDEQIELPIVPMIDCAFLLLVFFLIATQMKRPDAAKAQPAIPVTLAHAPSPKLVPTEQSVRVLVGADGAVATASHAQPYDSLGALVTDLKTYHDARPAGQDAVVVIAADRACPFERVVQVWNAVKTAGIAQACFAVQPGQPTER